MNSRTYSVGRSTITVRFGDIAESKAEVLVSSDDSHLSMGGGVSARLRAAGGPGVVADAYKMIPAQVGDVVVSTAGALTARYIFHAVTIGVAEQQPAPSMIVRQASRRAMALLPALGCRSIAFPAIGAGTARIPYATVAVEMATALVEAVIDSQESYQIELYLLDRFETMGSDEFFVFFEQFAARQLGLAASPSGLAPPPGATPRMNDEQASEAHRRQQVYEMLRHLDARRNKREAELLETLGDDASPDAGRLSALKEQLEEIQALRRVYEGQLAHVESPPQVVASGSVFVSSTSADLKAYRQAVRGAIEELALTYIGMEDFGAAGQAPANLIQQKVRESGVYLGILGMRYGSIDPGTGLSMTELEYRQALASAKPVCMFIIDDHAPITAGMVEGDSVRFARLLEFKARVMQDHTCVQFTDPEDLAAKARSTLERVGR